MKWIIDKEDDQTSYSAIKIFKVTEKTTQLSIRYTMKQPTWLRFLLFDEKGTLRAQKSGLAKEGIVFLIDTKETSIDHPVISERNDLLRHVGDLNTLPGPIGLGEWTIEYALHVSDSQSLQDRLGEIEIELNSKGIASMLGLCHRPYEVSWSKKGATDFQLDEQILERTLKTGSRWYKGDFHTHTVFSDGKMTRELNMEQAAKQKLDFFVATDHDLMPTSWPLSFHCLVLPGVEITSHLGHYNRLFGLTHPFQEKGYEVLNNETALVESFAKKEKERHLNSINHPFLTEWKWLAETLPLKVTDSLEIWNDPTYEANAQATEQALNAWDLLLEDGYRITGIGGSDSHLLPVETYPNSNSPSVIGDPATYVWADELNGKTLKESVAAGRVYVSRFDYKVDLIINGGIIGDYFSKWHEKVEAICTVDAPNSEDSIIIEWIIDGKVYTTAQSQKDNQLFTLDPRVYHYVRVNIRKPDGTLLAFTNPVFFGEKDTQLKTWEDVLGQL